MARFRGRIAAATRAYPAVATQVEASTDDTFPLVGAVSQTRSVDAAIVRVARRTLALRTACPVLTKASVLVLSLMSTENGIVGVILVASGVESTRSTFCPLEGQTTA